LATVPELELPDVEAMTAEEALLWAYEQFGDRMCLTCSWQRQSSVLVHMVFGELGLDVPVVELDTQLFFKETYETTRPARRALRAPARAPRGDHRRAAGNPGRAEPLGDQPGSLLSHPQGRAARACAGSLRRVDHRIRREQALTRADAKRVEWSERYGVWKIQPVVRLGREARPGVHPRSNRDSTTNPLHDAGYPSIGCIPCTRPVVEGEDERADAGPARTSSSAASTATHDSSRRAMTEHIYAHEHPETERRRDGGFHHLVHRPVRIGKTTIAHLVGPESRNAARSSSTSTATPCARICRRGSVFSKEDRDANIERIGWVAARLTRQRRRGDRRGDFAVRGRRGRRRESSSRSGAPSSRCTSPRPSRSARAAMSRVSTRRRSRARSRASPVSTTRTKEPSNPEVRIDTEQHEPEESAQLILQHLEEGGLIPAAVRV